MINKIINNLGIKQARIKNLREFIPIAVISGYNLNRDYLVKEKMLSLDESLFIKINIHNGLITFSHYYTNDYLDIDITYSLTHEDKIHYLKDIDYLVEWIN